MKRLLIVVLMLGLAVSIAKADIPDPSNCTCDLDVTGRCYMCPDGIVDHPGASFCVNVRNAAGNPIPNIPVTINIGGQGTGQTYICPGQTLTVMTEASGTACFNLGGSGCYKHQPDACVIVANNVTIREYPHVMSSDYADWDDNGVPGRWDRLVNPVDLAAFVTAYQGGVGPASCHDYDNDGTTGPTDLAIFIVAYMGGANWC